ncbi:hypothetical protein [Streptomyces sp. URMC 129]
MELETVGIGLLQQVRAGQGVQQLAVRPGPTPASAAAAWMLKAGPG